MKSHWSVQSFLAGPGGSDSQSGANRTARCFLLQGRVQGLGVRPAIARLAANLNLNGMVQNTGDGVFIHVEGEPAAVTAFTSQLSGRMPALAQFVVAQCSTVSVIEATQFRIVDGCADGHANCQANGPLAAQVPVDLGLCQECRAELADSPNRRFEYPFSSCTQCGPRYSIIEAMPFERHDTSMKAFALCDACQQEFQDPTNRRYHAQTNACPDCGPRVSFESAVPTNDVADDAIAQAVGLIRAGGILALKGIGGYQLVCDATSEHAVRRLRQAKQRRIKPLAVMVRREEILSRVLLPVELEILNSPENPILIVDDIQHAGLASHVNPATNSLGLIFATTPLHAVLLEELQRPLVVTSGNGQSEPLVYENAAARELLAGLVDGWLHHDRAIERPLDDSVVRMIAGRSVTIRAARGLTPMPSAVCSSHAILAVGADQKVACGISNGQQAILGPHLGDMTTLGARQRFLKHVASLQQLYRTSPEVIVHDLHPDYFTTRWASEQKQRTIAVQHHHAHVVSGMIEQNLLDQEVLGIAFDGTGFGTDGTIWGGEFLLVSKHVFRRVGSLLTFALPGGDLAVLEPWRIAVSLLRSAMPDLQAEEIAGFWKCGEANIRHRNTDHENKPRELPDDMGWAVNRSGSSPTVWQVSQVQRLVDSGISPLTSSMGRVFDGIASLVLGITHVEYEGEAAVRLEAACTADPRQLNPSEMVAGHWPGSWNDCELVVDDQSIVRIDWRPVVQQIVAAIQQGRPVSEIALQFHASVANLVAAVAMRWPDYPIVLAGGCFQNRTLTELVVNKLRAFDRIIAGPGIIPPNDGGLAAGQLAIAAAILDQEAQQGERSCV